MECLFISRALWRGRAAPVPVLYKEPCLDCGRDVAAKGITEPRGGVIMMNKIPMTADGYNRLREELRRLKTIDRPAIIRAIAEARTHGDLAENAEYHAARDRQSFIEGRVAELEDKMARAEVIDVSKL